MKLATTVNDSLQARSSRALAKRNELFLEFSQVMGEFSKALIEIIDEVEFEIIISLDDLSEPVEGVNPAEKATAALDTAKALSGLRLLLPTLLAEVSMSTQNKDADGVNYSRILTTTLVTNIADSVAEIGREDIQAAHDKYAPNITEAKNAVLDQQVVFLDVEKRMQRQAAKYDAVTKSMLVIEEAMSAAESARREATDARNAASKALLALIGDLDAEIAQSAQSSKDVAGAGH